MYAPETGPRGAQTAAPPGGTFCLHAWTLNAGDLAPSSRRRSALSRVPKTRGGTTRTTPKAHLSRSVSRLRLEAPQMPARYARHQLAARGAVAKLRYQASQ